MNLVSEGEQAIDRGRGQAGVVLVDHVVVRRVTLAQIRRLSPGELEIFFEHGNVARKVVAGPRLGPRVVTATVLGGLLLDERGGRLKVILTGGSYLDLMRRWKHPVFFDQQGSLAEKLGIRHVPALVSQEDRRLRIDELL